MKYYAYSVKEVLSEYFGVDTLATMRKPRDSIREVFSVVQDLTC